jgi:hypothetical protein
MPVPIFINLVGVNPALTILDLLKTAPPAAQAAISSTLNGSLATQLATQLADTPVLAGLAANMPAADIVAAQNLTIPAFIKQQLDPMVAKDPVMQQAVDGEIAELTTTATVGSLLNLNQPLQTHPLFQADVNKANIGTLLATSPALGTNQQLQADFIDRYAASTGTIQQFWAALSTDPEFASAVPELQLTFQLGTLTLNNTALVSALRSAYNLSSPRSLISQTDVTQLAQLITSKEIAIPGGIPGGTPAAYAANIMGQLKAAFPSDFVAKSLATSSDITNRAVATVLGNAPDLDLRTTNINTYLAANSAAAFKGIAEDVSAVMTRLMAVQRVFRVNPDGGTIQTLLSSGFDSARKIAATPRAVFLRQYSAGLGGKSAAAQVYSSAQQIAGMVSNLHQTISAGLRGGNPMVIGSPVTEVQQILNANLPNWQTLFGSTSTCQCAECTALDGPAAYFVDLLQFLNAGPNNLTSGTTNIAGYTPLDVLIGYCNNPNNYEWTVAADGTSAKGALKAANPKEPPPLGRRPDLAYLQLTCANSDTALPYVDLVNEILESYVYYVGMQGHADLPRQSKNTPPDATTAQLTANPDNVLSQVYASTGTPPGPLTQTAYPLSLPYDRYLDSVRNYLNNLGVTRAQILETFTLPSSTLDEQAQLAVEVLNSTEYEYSLITGVDFTNNQITYPATWVLYGFSAESWPSPTPVVTPPTVTPIDPNRATFAVTVGSSGSVPTLTVSGTPNSGDSVSFEVILSGVEGSPVTIEYVAQQNDNPSSIAIELANLLTSNVTLKAAGISATPAGSLVTFVLSTSSWVDTLGVVQTFLDCAGVCFAELVALLKTRFFNSGQTILLQPNPNNPCDVTSMLITGPLEITGTVDKHPIVGLGALALFYMNVPGFLRLKRRLCWTIAELDKAILAISAIAFVPPGSTLTSRSFVLAASQIKTLQGLLSLSVTQLLSLWVNIDTDGRDSLYIQLFQNKAVVSPLDPAFALQYQASLPHASTSFQNDLKGTWSDQTLQTQASYDNGTLYFTGTMTEEQHDDLLTWANQDTATLLAIDDLYNQRAFIAPDIVATTGQNQPLICDHLNTIQSALQVGAADLSAIAADCNLIPTGADLKGFAFAVIGGSPTVTDSVSLTLEYTSPSASNRASVSCIVRAGDTLESIATALESAINANTTLQADGVSSAAQGTVINIYVGADPGVSLTLTPGTTPTGASETVAISNAPKLNVANLSALYRYTVLAQALDISVRELIALKSLIGINPFVAVGGAQLTGALPLALTQDGELPSSPTNPAVQFVHAAQAVESSNFSIEQLTYLYRAIPDAIDALPPLLTDQEQMMAGLSAGLQKIAAANAFSPDPSGVALQKKLAAVLPADQVDPTMALVAGTATYVSGNSVPAIPLGATRQANLQPSLTTVISVGGTVTQDDTVWVWLTLEGLTGSPVLFSYPVVAGDSPASIAVELQGQIQNALGSSGISASVVGSVISLVTPIAGRWGGMVTPSNASETVVVSVPDLDQASYLTNITVGGVPTENDLVALALTIGGVAGSPLGLQYTVAASDTTNLIAANLAAQINNNPTMTAAGISAETNGPVICVSSQFMLNPAPISLAGGLTPAPTETVSSSVSPVSVTIGGTATNGDIVILNLTLAGAPGSPFSVSYAVAAGDNPNTIATALANLINALVATTPVLSSAGVSANPSAAVVVITTAGSASLAITGNAVHPSQREVITLGGVAPVYTVTVGAAGPRDVITLHIAPAGGAPSSLAYTVADQDNPASIALSLKALINGNVTLYEAGVSASVAGPVLTISGSQSPSLTVSAAVTPATPTATENIIVSQATANMTGSATQGDTLILTVSFTNSGGNAVSVILPYVVSATDTMSSIANALVGLVAKNSTLNTAAITATTNTITGGASLTVNAPAAISSSLTVNLVPTPTPEATETIMIAGCASAQGYVATLDGSPTTGDIVTLTLLAQDVPACTVRYRVASGDKLSSIVNGLATQINSNPILNAAGISANVTGSVVITVLSLPSLSPSQSWAYTLTPAISTAAASEKVTIAGGPLQCVGPMRDSTFSILTNVAFPGPAFDAALSDLYLQARKVLDNNLSFLPSAPIPIGQLINVVPGSSAADRYNYVLAGLLSYLCTAQSTSLVEQTLSQSLGLTSASVAMLLENNLTNSEKSLLPSQSLQVPSVPRQPAIVDFLGGMLGFYYSDLFTTAATAQIDPGINVSATPANIKSVQWFGQLVAPTSDKYTFYVNPPGSLLLWLDEAQVVLGNTVVLQAGHVYSVRAQYINNYANTSLQLQWSASASSQQTIPATAFILGASPTSNTGVSSMVIPGGAYDTLSLLNRIAVLINGFSMKPDEVAYLSANSLAFQGAAPSSATVPFDLSQLPLDFYPSASVTLNPKQTTIDTRAPAWFNQWRRLSNLYNLKRALPSSNVGLFDIFPAASKPGNSSSPVSAVVANTVLQATGWSPSDFKTLIGTSGFNLSDAGFINEIALDRLTACFGLGSRLGVSASQLLQWAATGPDATQARDIETTVRSKYNDASWAQVGPTLTNPIRERSKDALIAYILNMQPIVAAGFTTADDLYDYFLIDVQMCTCMQTSRLVQATAAVQQFTQRCLLNLEYDSADPSNVLNVPPSSVDANEWEQWRKNYRVWQAAVDVFLFPENWIDPTTRDDRTPFFQDLQNRLLQTSVTMDNVEEAYLGYLDQLQQVARLEIVGLYVEKSGDLTTPLMTHVIGRTYAQPYVYYYRYLDQSTPNQYIWSAWETIDLDIKDAVVLPVVLNGRLFLFWPVFTNNTIGSGLATQDPNLLYFLQQIQSILNSGTVPSGIPMLTQSQVTSILGLLTNNQDQGSQVLQQILTIVTSIQTNMTNSASLAAEIQRVQLEYQLANLVQSSIAQFNPSGASIGSQPSLPPTQQMQIQFAWSEYREGQWTKGHLADYLSLQFFSSYQQDTTDQINWQFPGVISPGETGTVFVMDPSGQSPQTYALPTYTDNLLFRAVGDFTPPLNITVYCLYKEICQDGSTGLYTPGIPTVQLIGQFSFDYTAFQEVLPPTSPVPPAWPSWQPEDNLLNVYTPSMEPYPFSLTTFPSLSLGLQTTLGSNVYGDPEPVLEPPLSPLAVPSLSYTLSATADRVGSVGTSSVWGNSLTALQLGLLSPLFYADATASRTFFVSLVQTGGNSISDSALTSPAPPREVLSNGSVASVSISPTPISKQTPQIQSRAAKGLATPQHAPTYNYSGSPAQGSGVYLVEFENHYHPWVNRFIEKLNSGDIPCLLDISTQVLGTPLDESDATFDFSTTYVPNPSVVTTPYPKEVVDLRLKGAYAIYNWELFFHIPFLIATQLSQNQQFEDAQTWFHYIFNPTNDVPLEPSGKPVPVPNRYWNFLFFRNTTQDGQIQDLVNTLSESENNSNPFSTDAYNQVAQWHVNPFDPDVIARLRPVAYQKAVVMAYIDNLIAWGDNLFAQNTRESINEATQLYVLADKILGPNPITVRQQGTVLPRAFSDLQWGGVDNAMVQLENAFPFSVPNTTAANNNSSSSLVPGVGAVSAGTVPYFCTPSNTQLLAYWGTVADRLYKIRHCMNIQGQVQQLPLFSPPINPALQVAAEAAGVDLSSVLSDISAAVPYYRFSYMMARAQELCADAKSLGGALLSALEKKDAEALAQLRSGQEVAVQSAILTLKQMQVNEANSTLQALRQALAVTTYKQSYYQGLIGGGWSTFENAQVAALTTAQAFKTASQLSEIQAGMLSLLPNLELGTSGMSSPVVTVSFGGSQLGAMEGAVSRTYSAMADIFSFLATMASLTGGWNRRSQEWSFQVQTAGLEMAEINSRIAAANIRVQIAQQDAQNQQLLIGNAQAVQDFLTTKFTNEDLYSWMIDQVSSLYFQCYQMAYDFAKRAEVCYRFELGLSTSNYIQFGYWDSLKQGLLSGDKLYLDLKRLETAYIDQNHREYEITRSISLLQLDSLALITLKETGQCVVSLPEAFFDMDYPGHYMRRIKTVGLTIPCVTGPYTSVNCTLTLVQSKIRWDVSSGSGYQETPAGSDPRFFYNFAASQSVATSTAQNDSGMFEVNFRDERYLPFEGAGAVSQWLISMPPQCNAFDFETITDVLFNLRYTARDGGSALGAIAARASTLPGPQAQSGLNAPTLSFPKKQANLTRCFSSKHEFPTEWYQFMHPAPAAKNQSMSVLLTNERFPFQYRGKKISVSQVQLFLQFEATYPIFAQSSSTPLQDYDSSSLPIALIPPSPLVGGASSSNGTFVSNPSLLGMPSALISLSAPALLFAFTSGRIQPWTLSINSSDIQNLPSMLWDPNTGFLKAEIIDDLFLVCQYSVG